MVPGSPWPQAISFSTWCETEIAPEAMQAVGQVGIVKRIGPQIGKSDLVKGR